MPRKPLPFTMDELRRELLAVAADPRCPASIGLRLYAIRDRIGRRPAIRRARNTSTRITPAIANSIRGYAKAYPDVPLHRIAELFKVNPGRVSEALSGRRARSTGSSR